MTLHEPETAGKRPRRFWLYAPYVVLLIGAVAWGLGWFWIRGQVAARMDAAAERLRLAGYTIEWTARRIGGFPFRVDVTLEGLRMGEASGWALATPEVRAEAYAYGLDHWIAYAPKGLTLKRPVGGEVSIAGPALRASYAANGRDTPRISIEAVKPVFNIARGAKPFVIGGADHLDLQIRPGGQDRAEFLLRVDKAGAPAGSILALIAQDRPMDIAWEGQVSHLSALRGHDWPAAAQAWSAAGGALDVEHGALNAGATVLNLRPGRLGVGWDGRLRGSVGLDLHQAPDLIKRLADARSIDASAADSAATVARARSAGGAVVQADLNFLAGATLFGPVAVGPSPKVY
jgi:hypothetical protein